MRAATMLAALLLGAAAPAGSNREYWDMSSPQRNADRVARLFEDVCIDHLGRSAEMASVIERSRAGFRSVYAGNETFGPVWDSPQGRIRATDHRHNHDGDECQIDLRRRVAPNAESTIAALRRRGLVKGEGQGAEFGATVFRRGEELIFVRYSAPEEATGVTEESAGLMLLIKRPAG